MDSWASVKMCCGVVDVGHRRVGHRQLASSAVKRSDRLGALRTAGPGGRRISVRGFYTMQRGRNRRYQRNVTVMQTRYQMMRIRCWTSISLILYRLRDGGHIGRPVQPRSHDAGVNSNGDQSRFPSNPFTRRTRGHRRREPRPDRLRRRCPDQHRRRGRRHLALGPVEMYVGASAGGSSDLIQPRRVQRSQRQTRRDFPGDQPGGRQRRTRGGRGRQGRTERLGDRDPERLAVHHHPAGCEPG